MSQVTPEGATDPKIANGGFRDYAIEGRQEIDYLSVVQSGNDGICIHLITGQSANAGRKFAWNGDLRKACGAPWYPQSNPVTNAGEEEKEYRPACVWIDGNGDSGHNFKGFNFHLGSFGGDASEDANKITSDAWAKNKDLLCKSEPRFSLYEDIEIGMQAVIFAESPTTEAPGTSEYDNLVLNRENWVLGEAPGPGKVPQKTNGKALIPTFLCAENNCPPTGGSFDMDLDIQEFTRRSSRQRRATKRRSAEIDHRGNMIASLRKRQAVHADRLIVSNIAQHSAVELCNSVSSFGPDLVSTVEGMFCDMSEKQLWPVCVDAVSTYCFDIQSETVRGSSPSDRQTKISSSGTTESHSDGPGGQQVTAGGILAAIEVGIIGDTADPVIPSPSVPMKSYIDVSTWDP